MPHPYTTPVHLDADLTKFSTHEVENMLVQTRSTLENAKSALPDVEESVVNLKKTVEVYGTFAERLEAEVTRRLEALKGKQ